MKKRRSIEKVSGAKKPAVFHGEQGVRKGSIEESASEFIQRMSKKWTNGRKKTSTLHEKGEEES